MLGASVRTSSAAQVPGAAPVAQPHAPPLQPSRVRRLCERLSAGRLRAQKEEGAVAAVRKGLALLDRHLARHTYLVGHAATLADIVGVCNLYHGYTKARRAALVLCASVSGGACRGLCSVCEWAAAGPPSAADNTLMTACQRPAVGVPHCPTLIC